MRKLLLTLSCALGILSCDNSSPGPEPVPFLKVEVIDSYTYGSDKWIFATSETGELLDVKQVVGNLELATLKEFTSFDLTILVLDPIYFSITTYRDFHLSEIVLGNPNAPSQIPAPIGMAKINITNFTGGQPYSFAPSFSSSFYGSSYYYSYGNPTYDGNTYGVFKMLAKEPDKVVVTGRRSGTLVYQIFDNVTDGSVVTADFNDFLPHQDQFTIENSSGSVTSFGLADDDRSPFTLVENARWDLETQPPLAMGTVPGFTRYQTTINAQGLLYTKLGGPVSSFTPPEYSVNILNRTLSNFSASIDIPYEYQTASWTQYENNKYTVLTVYSDESSTPSVNHEVPPEIRARYPSLSLDELQFQVTTFYHSPGSWSYADFIGQRFKNEKKSEYEYYEISAY